MARRKGIDVSAHQGEIDWKKVKDAGIEFAILRAGYGNDISQKDTYFDRNIKAAQKQGIPVGAYWFSYATSVADARKEAKVFQQVLKGYKLPYPVFYDFEYDSVRYAKEQGVRVTKKLATEFALAFLSEMESAGYFAGNYTNLDFYNNYFDTAKLKRYTLWLASWGSKKPAQAMGIWQYADNGTVAGISGKVDLNYAYEDYPAIIQKAGYNGYAAASKTAVTTAEVNLRQEAHTGAKVLTVVPKGKTVKLLEDDGWGWSQVEYQHVVGWMSNAYLKGSGRSGYKTGVCNGSDVNVRKEPSKSSVVLRMIQKGKTFQIVCILPNRWLHIKLDGKEGYLYYDPSYITIQ